MTTLPYEDSRRSMRLPCKSDLRSRETNACVAWQVYCSFWRVPLSPLRRSPSGPLQTPVYCRGRRSHPSKIWPLSITFLTRLRIFPCPSCEEFFLVSAVTGQMASDCAHQEKFFAARAWKEF